jgi:hypothetical protein
MNKIFNDRNFKIIFYFIIQSVYFFSFYLSWKYAKLKNSVYLIDLAINFFNLLATILLIIYHYHSGNRSSLIIKSLLFILVLSFNIDLYFIYSKQKQEPHYFDKIFNVNI